MRNRSFTSLGYSYNARDGAAYWGGARIAGAELETFVPLSHHYAVDARRVYCQDHALRGADRASFRVLNALYAKDDDKVYYYSSVLKDAEASSFEAVGGDFDGNSVRGYARDRNHVFHVVLTIGKPSIIKSASAATFRALGHGYGTDGSTIFHERTRLQGAKIDSWRYLGSGYSKDAHSVYFLGDRLTSAEAQTFEALPCAMFFGRDAHRFYRLRDEADLEAYLLEISDVHVMVGTVDAACVIDEAGDPTTREEIATGTSERLRLTLRCEAWLRHPSPDPAASPGGLLELLTEGPGGRTSWLGHRCLWLLTRADPKAPPSLRSAYFPALGFYEFLDPDYAGRLLKLFDSRA